MLPSSPPVYFGWLEHLKPDSPNPPELMAVTVRPGDSIHVYVAYSTFFHQANFYIANNTITPPSDHTVIKDFPDDGYYDGSTVEWIDERPSALIPGIPDPIPLDLANFGHVDWSNVQAWASDGNWYSLESTDRGSVSMWDGSTILALPYAPSSPTSFTDQWTHC